MNNPSIDQAFAAATRARRQGDLDGASALYARVLAAAPDYRGARNNLIAILEMARTETFHPRLAARIADCLSAPGANWEALARPAVHQLRLRYDVPDSRQPPESFAATPELLATLASDVLFQRTLSNTINRDYSFECWLTALRRALATQLASGNAGSDIATVAAAVALQAFNNEFVFAVSETEAELSKAAIGRIAASETPQDADLLLAALYAPLTDLPNAEALAALPLDRWSGPIAPLIGRALLAPLTERRLAANIQPITPIADPTSRQVRAMYEANPYPRWIALGRREPIDIRAALARTYPRMAPLLPVAGPLSILMPGAGTGQHPLSVATNYRDAQVFAVDLSLTSLAYGKRMAIDHGIGNIEFRQGDILALGSLGRTFDHIECVGVLHHMGDPNAGLRVLSECLVPGGLMRIGLYAEGGRRTVVEARRIIAEQAYAATPDVLRQFRHDVATGHWPSLAPLLADDDFYSLSLLRDLVFHVHEHRFTMPGLRRLLADLPLRVLGFEFPAGLSGRALAEPPARQFYRVRYPNEPTCSDLANWEQLEAERPDLFTGYTFWCQKLAG